jgi:hypothetical protein
MLVLGKFRMFGGAHKRQWRPVTFRQIRPTEQAQPRLTLQ